MPYGEIEAKSMGYEEELLTEPCSKKLKSTEEAYVVPYHGSGNFYRKQEKTGSDWTPVTITNVRGHSYPQEDKTQTTDLLKPAHDGMPSDKLDVTESVDSQVVQDMHPPLVSTDDEIYSTSKAFIGPIYKPPEKKKRNDRRNQADTINGRGGKREQKKQKFNSKTSEIDNELFQFYKEIEELENEKDDSESSCKEPEPSEKQLIACYQSHNNDLLKSEEEKKKYLSNGLQPHCDYQQCLGNEPGEYPCNGQVIPTFCDNSFASFRPEWQAVHSFVVPQDPHLPNFNYHLNIERFSVPPNPPSNIFHAQDDFEMQNGYFVNSCHANWDCLTFDENNEYIDCSDITSSDHPSRNDYSVQDGYASNGFCETSEGYWKDPSLDECNGTDRFINQQFEEEKLHKLQKLLILLRGLPGSGKTTLSRERDLKKTGHRFSKARKRNRKRSKKQNGHNKIMEENSFETLNYLTPGIQDPSQSEEEDLEETKRESECSLTVGLINEVGDFVNVHKDKRQEDINSENSLPDVMSVELDSPPKNYLPKDNDDLFLSLSLMPNESFVSCPTVIQNLSYVASDDCSVTEVEERIENRNIMTLNTQDKFVEAPCLLMQKGEMVDESLLNETSPCRQYTSRTSDKVLRQEQAVNTTKNNNWAFFSNDLSDGDLQLGSDRQPYSGSWPEGPHKFICEQRPKKKRRQKLAHPDSRGQLIKLISTSEGPGNSPETLIEEKLSIENEDLSSPTENIDSVIETETNIFQTHFVKLDILKSTLHSTETKKRRQKRIFSLAPNFNLLEESHTNVKEMGKCDLLTESHGLKIILEEEKDEISEINNEENKQHIMTFDYHSSWFYFDIYFDIVKDSLLNVGGQFYSYYLLFNRVRHSMYFYRNPIPSLMLQYPSSFWKISFSGKKLFSTFNSQRRVDDKLNDVRFTSSEILSSQPDTLYSFGVTSDLHSLNESFVEKLKTWEEPRPLPFLQTQDNQDLTSPDYFDSLELPLSQEFAFQLVKLFGSPGVPVESLLPEDCMVPLDWKTLKMIYLQWKTSVEKRQKKIG
ncbi:NEDD4-binding protein 2-like 2 isoform X2 [Budorcas taxicolor]|uniref:NEDD4-binding protein 2-like 2 isoform X2 n=1 Tax=Budorcas taxicolor TaxID=37181 RepID=UPI002283F0BD|nr:NEDD4-binding protein 2-like 2 isoform X2 [Budorcas taxicolor]